MEMDINLQIGSKKRQKNSPICLHVPILYLEFFGVKKDIKRYLCMVKVFLLPQE
ncbi:hypothetical protein [Lawsonia intracellularis]|nr:hypothetical protein [Lawsonia intracellularis]